MSAADDRTLAIMMKAPRPGRVKTRLAPTHSADQIVALYRALVEDTIELSRRLHVRTVAICPAGDETELAGWLRDEIDVRPQRGIGLAAGLRSTFEQLCTDERTRVIAFNADSPHLPDDTLESAFAALLSADLVVGPCDDGGYYLVGAKRPHENLFDPGAIGRESACHALLVAAERQRLRVVLTVAHYDIDVPQDVVRLAGQLMRNPTRASRTAAILATWALASRKD
jgi:rSAM/selenodomain-associated transferase 1